MRRLERANAANRRNPCGWEFLDVVAESVQPVCPFVQKRLILPAIRENQVVETEGECAIRAGADLQVNIRQFCGFGAARVNHDHLAPFFTAGKVVIFKRWNRAGCVG